MIHSTAHGKCGSELQKDIMSKLVSSWRLSSVARERFRNLSLAEAIFC